MIPDETLTAILEAREAATAEPWTWGGSHKTVPNPFIVDMGVAARDHATFMEVKNYGVVHSDGGRDEAIANAVFITLACNNAAELVSEVRALRRQVETLQGSHTIIAQALAEAQLKETQ